MERNDDFTNTGADLGGTTGAGSAGTGSTGAGSGVGAGYGATGGSVGGMGTQDAGGTGGYGAGSGLADVGGAQGAGGQGQGRVQQGKEAVANTFNNLKEKASNLNLREKATNLNMSLADKLEAGADRLRQRGQSAQFAGAGVADAGTTGMGANDQASQVGSKLAAGMESTADWLRNGDLQGSIENQVRTNPGRTLLIALGLGYVLGKAFRR